METKLEELARTLDFCLLCGRGKSEGCVVCWGCFKQEENPYKFYDGTFDKWLQKELISQ